ncbi:MAG TPA: murein biosynthesis integral membrane protein MurJ [Anaerolineales bacterium]|nr:murein biosynthesis integral membrane protein MurJ [Anaerolineales bacterium]
MSKSESSASRQIARASGVVMVGFIISSLLGLISQVLITRAFGTSSEIDAFTASNRLTEIIFNLMAGGALASAFVPTFTSFLTRNQTQRAWRLVSSIASLLFVGLGLVCASAWITAPWLVENILAPGFEGPQQILTVSLLRVMLIAPVIFSLSGLAMGILNGYQRFFLPAIASGCYRLGLIIGVLFLSPRIGVLGLAWGVVLGACLHLVVQLPGLLSLGGRFFRGFGLGVPEVRQVGRLMAPRLLGQAVVQVNFLVSTILASGMPEGSLAAIYFAFTLMLMPQTVIAQAVGVASLPTFSAQVARGEMEALKNTFGSTLRGVVFLSLPASVGLILLRRPIVALLFERGLFTAESTELVAWALLWYAIGLVGHSILEVVVRAFYAMYDTRTPVTVGVIAMSLNVVFSIVFAAIFSRLGLPPHGGLALANSLATALEVFALVLLLRRRLGGLGLRRLQRGIIGTAAASVVMAGGLWLWTGITAGASVWLSGVGGVLLGVSVYWALAFALGVPEARQIPRMVLSRRS